MHFRGVAYRLRHSSDSILGISSCFEKVLARAKKKSFLQKFLQKFFTDWRAMHFIRDEALYDSPESCSSCTCDGSQQQCKYTPRPREQFKMG
eukprot:COSAG05_NODE_13764_length_418_cov_1.683386_1_plen_91_part_10